MTNLRSCLISRNVTSVFSRRSPVSLPTDSQECINSSRDLIQVSGLLDTDLSVLVTILNCSRKSPLRLLQWIYLATYKIVIIPVLLA